MNFRKRCTALVAAAALTLGLIVAPAANAGPILSGGLSGDYMFCAPGQDFDSCIPASWRTSKSTIRCSWNADWANQNVTLGFRVGFNPSNTYQGLLARKWFYCSHGPSSTPVIKSINVGPGYCVQWSRWVAIDRTYPDGFVQTTIYGVKLAEGVAVGANQPGQNFTLSTGSRISYHFNGYRC